MRPRSHNLETEVRSLFCESLQVCASGAEATDWLLARRVRDLLNELAAENAKLMTELEVSSKPTVAILNRPELVHFATTVGTSGETLELLLQAVESALVARYFPHSGIWREYSAALSQYHRGVQTDVRMPKAKGYEKFMLPYIRYMRATNGEERVAASTEAAESFAVRNADRRLTDWVGLDGDGKRPVRWDFRMFALERAQSAAAAST